MSTLRDRIVECFVEGMGTYKTEVKLSITSGTIKNQFPELYEQFIKRAKSAELARDAEIIETWVAMRFPPYKQLAERLKRSETIIAKATLKYFAIPKERGITITLTSKV